MYGQVYWTSKVEHIVVEWITRKEEVGEEFGSVNIGKKKSSEMSYEIRKRLTLIPRCFIQED